MAGYGMCITISLGYHRILCWRKKVHKNDISDIEICNIPYNITGKSFSELKMYK